MREAAGGHWARMGESTFVAGIWFLYGLHRICGRWPFRLCLYPVILLHWLLRGEARRASLDYLQRVQAHCAALGHPPGGFDSLRHMRLFAESLLDKLLVVAGRYPLESVQAYGREAMYAYAAGGRGAVIVTAHMGCLEVCRSLGERRGTRMNILVHTRHAQRFNRILQRLSPGHAMALLEVTEMDASFAQRLAERIEAGEFVVIAGDRVPVSASQTVEADFLGAPAQWPVGPYVLASLLRCPLYLLTCIHAGDSYRIDIECLAERVHLPRGSRAMALQALAQRYAQALTQRLQQSPLDWINFFPFWERQHERRPR